MVKKDQDFETVSGDHHDLNFDVGEDASVWTSIQWRLARRIGLTNLLEKTNASASQIEVTGAGNDIVVVHLTPSDTASLEGDYYHELEVSSDENAQTYTLAFGRGRFLKDHVTD